MRRALALTGFVSTAGGLVTHGFFFLARAAYGFDDAKNLWLAAALFVPYIPAALLAGRVGRRIGPRTALHVTNVAMILAGIALATRPAEWVLWLAAPAYNGAAGMMWPFIEGYVAGGQHGGRLHRAIGAFNLTWSLTLVPALWIVGIAGDDVTSTFAVLVALHVLSAVAIAGLPAEPLPLDHTSAEPVRADYPLLLRSSRILLPISYLLLDALSPLLPGVWARAGINGSVGPFLSSTWMVARFFTFALLTQWSGWRGRVAMLVGGAAALIGGFAAALGGGDVPVVLGGLCGFGLGQGMLYYAALYYGMAVGKGEVDSGGHHEAVIGLGYLGGPALALLGLGIGIAPLHAVGAIATLGLVGAFGGWMRNR